ncbi:hypothetical protein GCM10010451_52070 [Streptomyces virens]|uniref:Uncharacterized protein n=1 Tax=Streptomyces virens TaxID=285572 RepID=A0ABP6Q3E9_9ACTN
MTPGGARAAAPFPRRPRGTPATARRTPANAAPDHSARRRHPCGDPYGSPRRNPYRNKTAPAPSDRRVGGRGTGAVGKTLLTEGESQVLKAQGQAFLVSQKILSIWAM